MSAPLRIRRSSISSVAAGEQQNEELKGYLDRLLKLIPAEGLGAYLVGSGFIPRDQPVVLVVWTIICLSGVVLIKAFGTADARNNEPPDWTHVAISTIAFLIWVYTLGGPFVVLNLHAPFVGSLLVITWTYFLPIFYKGKP
jgi:hypothetical protein